MNHSRTAVRSSRRSTSGTQRLRRAVAPLTELLEQRCLMTATVVATVANDADNSRSLGAGDPRLAGWTVFVDYNSNTTLDAGEPSAITNSNGVATITGVVGDDNWDIREVLQAGYAPQTSSSVVNRMRVPDNKTSTLTFLNVATVAATGSISGTVWNDLDRDGIHAATDPGIAGWTVFVDLNTDRVLNAGEPTAITDGNGHYTFTNLAPAKYKVREITPSGWDPTIGSDGAASATVTGGGNAIADFGNFNINALGTIRGSVWNDVNADGARAPGDPGLGDWTVLLDLNANGTADAGEPTAISDAGGVYSFPSINSGTYTVAVQLKPGFNASPGHPTSVTAVAANEPVGVADFAVFTPALGSVGGTIFNDANGNGFQDTTEVGLAGWTAYVDYDNDGTLSAGDASATTASDGSYKIPGVPVGSFNVREIAAAVGFSPTAPGTGVQLVRVLNGTDFTNVNFGNKQRTDSTISGVAFFDADHDGVRDAGEKPLPGLVVYLDINNDGVKDPTEPSVITSNDLFFTPAVNEAGTYQFTHLPLGTYHVRELVPDALSGTPTAARLRDVSLALGEQRTGVDFADVYRANELHGQVYDDQNKNHVRDPGEPGIAGVSVYIDLNRNNVADAGEPRSVTDSNGVYSFTTNLGPGSYVVRALHQSGRDHTYPTTTSGILLPGGVSHPSIGNVTPGSINTSLAKDQSETDHVSLTLPATGSLTNKVDVFLLFDDTGSFTANSPIVRAAFPQIISTLTAAMPGVDFGFGVGRFEEYANFASEFSTGRPFILNQPILSADTPGFATSIQAALDRTAPGYGGDLPETDIEALFQAATGAGFDGNNNGTTTDSGAAGLVSTQLTPGDSGDVPAFGSFTVDAAGNVLQPSGSIGGAGFRPGALPIILTATDTGFAFQPVAGETSITGLNGVTLPISAFTQTSRPTTPFNSGAGIQQTITALNALGALVIGLGTNGTATLDPRQGLESIATLTGAVNRSALTIANGTADPIDPGDPLYFQISSGFGATVTNGIVEAIENAASTVSVDLTLKASDPTVHLSFTPGVIPNVSSGQTAGFDVTFEGDGRPHRFDLQFVRNGTNVVLGSIPVVIGTPIVGDGYDYVELEDGEIEIDHDFGDAIDAALPSNSAPSFTKGADIATTQDSGAQTIAGWATSISPGPAADAGQLVDFLVTTDNDALFSVAPSIGADGTLSFTPAAGAAGTVTVSVRAKDSGGTVGGGQDTGALQTFTIVINSVPTISVLSRFDFLTRQALVLDFSADVGASLDVSDLQVIDRATNLPVALKSLSYDPVTHRATVLFSAPTLADGNYRLSIAAGALPGLEPGHILDFFVLAGDANGDRTVNFSDLLILAKNYNQPGRTFAEGNFDYSADGVVGFGDLLILAKHYGVSLSAVSEPTAFALSATPATPTRKRATADVLN